jgi:branched-subunit amino acid ABC-type transport system permease component
VRAYLPFVVIGLTTGGVYALAGLGLVLTYRTSGVFNFAHGGIGMVAAFVFYSLRQEMPTALAFVVVILILAPAMGLAIDRLLLRRLDGAGSVSQVVCTLGLLVALQALVIVSYGGESRRLAPLFPTRTYRVFDVLVGIDQTLVVAVALGAGFGLMVFFRHTQLGLQTRAVVDDRELAAQSGIDPGAVAGFSWMLGCALAAMSGVLFAPFIGLDTIPLTLLVVQAFGAAVVGRLASFSTTMIAAFGLAIAQSLTSKVVADLGVGWLGGLPSAIPFLLLFGVLVFYPMGAFSGSAVAEKVRRGDGRRMARGRFPSRQLVAFGLAAALAAPVLDDSRVFTLTATVVFLLVFSSLSSLVGLSRQVSLCHAVFVGFGASTFSHLLKAGVPYPLAVVLAGVLLVPVGAAMAIPAIRLSGLYLALATFGFGVLAQSLLFPMSIGFGLSGAVHIDRPGYLGGDLAFFYFVLGASLVGVIVIEVVRASRLGRILTALADSPRAVQALGLSPLWPKVLVFCMTAFFAGVSGALIGSMVRSVNSDNFNFLVSLIWIAVLVTAGVRTFAGALLASVFLVALPTFITSSAWSRWQPVLFGFGAILLAQAENGLVGLVGRGTLGQLRMQWGRRSTRTIERYLLRSQRASARDSTVTSGVGAPR